MKKLLSVIGSAVWYAAATAAAAAQDTTPRGPAEWTFRNWLGFCLQIGIFILAIIGIYKLAMSGGGERENDRDEKPSASDMNRTEPEEKRADFSG
ncbi:MAG: hypothetical protein RAO92_03485 [Candidatus Euphemobacter frigidus]|nr:hypothetical protein [Candidatus Euphemobacter frigidus]MDP8275444.1 hypothetical protein [Candidatus Euphemobacter frigidus]